MGQKRSAVVNRHDRRKAEGVEICSVEICSVEICSVGICSVEICSVGICSVDICSVEICSVEICSVEICSVEICSVEICSVEICSVEICSVEICRASSREGGGVISVCLRFGLQHLVAHGPRHIHGIVHIVKAGDAHQTRALVSGSTDCKCRRPKREPNSILQLDVAPYMRPCSLLA